SFGSASASSFRIDSDTQVSVTVPAGKSAGTVDVEVANSFGTSAHVSGDQYTYLNAPTVSGVSPGSGSAAGGTSVTLTGSGFLISGKAAVTEVDFDKTAVTKDITVSDDGDLTVTAPAGTAGTTIHVTVVTSAGTSATSS